MRGLLERKIMVNWVVQTNLGKHYSDDIEQACKSLGLNFTGLSVIPFDSSVPSVSTDSPTIFYGATRWISNIYESNKWNPGVFFNPESIFTLWSRKYGKHTLNYNAEVSTITKLGQQIRAGRSWKDNLIFIRPVSDQKEFAGDVISVSEIDEWSQKLMIDVPDFGEVPVIISEPVGIAHEWRLFIVDGKVSSGSHYRASHKLKTDPLVPKDVSDFALKMAEKYTPSPVFVMDIGESGDELYVIEIGCFNSAGFYDANVEKIVYDVSKYVEKNK